MNELRMMFVMSCWGYIHHEEIARYTFEKRLFFNECTFLFG